MSATTCITRTPADRLGRLHDLETKAEQIREGQFLTLGDIFDDQNVGIGLIGSALAKYSDQFLIRLASTRSMAELKPLAESFDDEPNTVWEDCRRKAAAAVLLYLREQENKRSRIVREANEHWVFLGYVLRDPKIIPLTQAQLDYPGELDTVVELWANKAEGTVQVWSIYDTTTRGELSYEALPGYPSNNRYVVEARQRLAAWRAKEAAA